MKMMPRINISDNYKKRSEERLYKMYSIKNRAGYSGTLMKCECRINGEHGIFKERLSNQSRDHVYEQLAYEIALVLGVPCCFSSCRRSNGVYGSFSRFEVDDVSKLTYYADILGAEEMSVDVLLRKTIEFTRNSINTFVMQLYAYIIFDFIMGQQDRHLENLAIEHMDNGKIRWYPLYDNGLCLSSYSSHDIAMIELKNGWYSSRIGQSSWIEENILRFRKLIYPGDLRNLVKYHKLNAEVLMHLIDKSDKYNQIPESRRTAMVDFMMKQVKMIHSINVNNTLIEV